MFGAAKASYQGDGRQPVPAAPARGGLTGTSGDAHSVDEAAFIRMREYVRAADRDDSILGALAVSEEMISPSDSFRRTAEPHGQKLPHRRPVLEGIAPH